MVRCTSGGRRCRRRPRSRLWGGHGQRERRCWGDLDADRDCGLLVVGQGGLDAGLVGPGCGPAGGCRLVGVSRQPALRSTHYRVDDALKIDLGATVAGIREAIMRIRRVLRVLLVAAQGTPGRTPVVLFPAYHLTKLRVTVHNQTAAPDCPRSGSFEYWFQNDHPSTAFTQTCQDQLLTLRFDPNPAKPMPARFSEQRGVDVRIIDYGRTTSAPFYEPMYRTLESAGYVRNKDIRVAGYDARLTPDMAGFLRRTKRLVEDTGRCISLATPMVRCTPSTCSPTPREPGGPGTFTVSRRLPATSPARGCSTRCCSP